MTDASCGQIKHAPTRRRKAEEMRTKRRTLQVVGALILAAFALFATGCQESMSHTIQPGTGQLG